MASAVVVARYFIKFAAEEQKRECLTPLHVQKLLYYAQGWSLALRGKPLFTEHIEAWTYGPVVSDVYSCFQEFKRKPIPIEQGSTKVKLSGSDKAFIQSIWESYKSYSAGVLLKKTHKEKPWLEARGDLPLDEISNEEISQETMETFFQQEFENADDKMFTLEQAKANLKSSGAKRGRPFREILAEVGLSDSSA